MPKKVLRVLRQVAGGAVIFFGALFLLVTIIAFAQGNLSARITGLVFSAVFLWAGSWILQRPRKVIALTNWIFKGGPYLQGRDLRIPYLLGTIPFSIFSLVLIALGSLTCCTFLHLLLFHHPAANLVLPNMACRELGAFEVHSESGFP